MRMTRTRDGANRTANQPGRERTTPARTATREARDRIRGARLHTTPRMSSGHHALCPRAPAAPGSAWSCATLAHGMECGADRMDREVQQTAQAERKLKRRGAVLKLDHLDEGREQSVERQAASKPTTTSRPASRHNWGYESLRAGQSARITGSGVYLVERGLRHTASRRGGKARCVGAGRSRFRALSSFLIALHSRTRFRARKFDKGVPDLSVPPLADDESARTDDD